MKKKRPTNVPDAAGGTDCDECDGCGYAAFSTDREPGVELQRCDACAKFKSDDLAAVQFVRDLELHGNYARAIAHELLGDMEPGEGVDLLHDRAAEREAQA